MYISLCYIVLCLLWRWHNVYYWSLRQAWKGTGPPATYANSYRGYCYLYKSNARIHKGVYLLTNIYLCGILSLTKGGCVICPYCKVEFFTEITDKIYCSYRCKRHNTNYRWRNRNKDKFRILQKRSYIKNKEKRLLYQHNFNKINKDKRTAYGLVSYAIKKRILIKPELCSLCHAKSYLHSHHNDYSKPLEVKWLCAVCHKKYHPRPRVQLHNPNLLSPPF